MTRAVQASKILENGHFKWHSESYFCFKYLSVRLSFLCINSYVCICAEIRVLLIIYNIIVSSTLLILTGSEVISCFVRTLTHGG